MDYQMGNPNQTPDKDGKALSQQAEQLENIEHIIEDLSASSGLDSETSKYIFKMYTDQSINLMKTLMEHLNNQNYQEVRDLLHKLKGSSGNVRAVTIMELAKEAEEVIKREDYDSVKILSLKIYDLLLQYAMCIEL